MVRFYTCNWREECLCYTEGENATYECCPSGRISDICGHSFTGNPRRERVAADVIMGSTRDV